MISEVNVTNQNKEDLKTKNDKNKKIIKWTEVLFWNSKTFISYSKEGDG